MIQTEIRKLVQYGLLTGLVPEEDKIYTINRLLELFGMEELQDLEEDALAEVENTGVEDLEAILSAMLDYAYEAGLMEENSVVYRDLFDTKIMSVLLPRPSEVIRKFRELYKEDPGKATDIGSKRIGSGSRRQSMATWILRSIFPSRRRIRKRLRLQRMRSRHHIRNVSSVWKMKAMQAD